MTTKITVLGFTVLAACGLSALGAPAASAGMFHFSAESTILTAEALNTQVFKPTPGDSHEYQCTKVSAEKGTVVEKTTEKITVKPKYESCTVTGSTPVTIDFTECAYEFTAATTEAHGRLRIECPKEGEHIHVKVTGFNLACMDVPAQEVTGVSYENTGKTSTTEQQTIDLNVTATGIVNTTKGVCKKEGESEVHNNGTYNGIIKLKGHNTIKEPSDVSYS